jgi:hypothetical protein
LTHKKGFGLLAEAQIFAGLTFNRPLRQKKHGHTLTIYNDYCR